MSKEFSKLYLYEYSTSIVQVILILVFMVHARRDYTIYIGGNFVINILDEASQGHLVCIA